MSSNNVNAIYSALHQYPAYNLLPRELQDSITNHVPVLHNANQVARLRANRTPRPSILAGDPTIPPKDGSSPFLTKLPAEVRRLVFQYLLPSKTKSIEPRAYQKRREEFLDRQGLRESAIRRARDARQQHQQHALTTPAQWQAQLANPLPPLNQQLQGGPFAQVQQIQPPPAQNNPPAGLPIGIYAPNQQWNIPPQQQVWVQIPGLNGQGAPPFTGNPLTGQGFPHFGNAAQQPFVPPANNFQVAPANMPVQGGLPQSAIPATMNNAANNVLPAAHHLFQGHQATMFGAWVAQQTTPMQQPNTYAVATNGQPGNTQQPGANLSLNSYHYDSGTEAEDHRHKMLKSIIKYDDTPERLIVTLMLTHSKFAVEVSALLYEEYTFEVHIHHDGVELLGFDRIPTLENWGADIEKTMGAFKSERHFCFQRMKHLEFVYFGCDPKDRLAGLRMRESTKKLVEFVVKENKELVSVNVSYEYEKKDENRESGLLNCIADELGNFWTTKEKRRRENYKTVTWRGPRQSVLHDVPNVQLVIAPLKTLRHVSKIEILYPEHMEKDKVLVESTAHLKHFMTAEKIDIDAQDEQTREEMLMDARRDKELQLAGAGRYYRHGTIGESSSKFLAEEEFMDEDSLTVPFGGHLKARGGFGKWQHFADGFDMDDDDVDMEVEAGQVKGPDGGVDNDILDLEFPGNAVLPATLSQVGSFNLGNSDIEQPNVLMGGRAPLLGRRQRKRKLSVAEDTSVFDGYMDES